MGLGLLRSLLRVRHRQVARAQLAKPPARRRQPFLETLETRTVLSILASSPKLTDGPQPPLDDSTQLTTLADPQNGSGGQQPAQNSNPGDQQPTQNDNPGDAPPSGSKNAPQASELDSQLAVPSAPVSIQLVPSDTSLSNQPQGPGDNGPGGMQGDDPGDPGPSQGDPSRGQSESSGNPEDGTTKVQGEVPRGSDGSPDRSKSTDANGDGNQTGGNPSPPPSGTASGTPAPPAPFSGTHDSPHDPARNSRPDSQGNTPKNPVDSGPDTKSNPSTSGGSVGALDGADSAPAGQDSTADKRQHSPVNGSASDGDGRSPIASSDGKPHTADGAGTAHEELHLQAPQAGPEPEPSNRNPVVAASPQACGPIEEASQRPGEERIAIAETRSRPSLDDKVPYPRTVEIITSAVSLLPEPAAVEDDFTNASPQQHELLTDGLALDFSSLRAEVQSFFEMVNNLGNHATDKQSVC